MAILTQANIATKLKICRATVSKALRDNLNVSPKTRKAAEKGLRIAEDMGVAGFGFKEIAQNFTPKLSIINQDPKKIRKTGAELLIETIKNPDIKFRKNIKIEEEFIWNDSILKKVKLSF